MPEVSRLTDQWSGTCTCHSPPIAMTGEITSASPDHFSGGLAVARVGDTVTGGCGHTGVIDSGSGTNFTNGKGKAHVGSTTTGCLIGSITTGNPKHIIG